MANNWERLSEAVETGGNLLFDTLVKAVNDIGDAFIFATDRLLDIQFAQADMRALTKQITEDDCPEYLMLHKKYEEEQNEAF